MKSVAYATRHRILGIGASRLALAFRTRIKGNVVDPHLERCARRYAKGDAEKVARIPNGRATPAEGVERDLVRDPPRGGGRELKPEVLVAVDYAISSVLDRGGVRGGKIDRDRDVASHPKRDPTETARVVAPRGFISPKPMPAPDTVKPEPAKRAA